VAWLEQLSELHFIRPWWFLGLLPLLLVAYYFWQKGKQSNNWSQVIDTHLLPYLLVSQGQVDTRNIKPWWFYLAGILAIIALSGPTFEKRPLPVFETELSKVVILDLSLSMDATDVEPSRLTRAKFKINDILDATKEGQIALIVYAGDAFVISPLTTDAKTIATLVPPLSPSLMPVLGSEPARAFELADELLTNAGVFSGQIIWITDGLDADDYAETRDFLTTSPHQVSILAVGTAEGAPIPLPDGQGFLKDSRGQIVVPSLNYGALEGLAKTVSASISPMTAGDQDIKFLSEQLQKPQEFIASDDDLEMDTWIEFGPWLLIPVILILSLAFRKGLVFGLLLLIVPIHTPSTQAAESVTEDRPAPSLVDRLEWLWLTPDQQGQKAFKAEKHNQAADLFRQPDWKSAALYRSGQYEAAIDANSEASDPTAWYNRGNALAKAGALEQAIAAYDEALAQQPNMEDAIFNKELVEQLLQQQQQDQQDQQEQQNQEQNQEQDQQNQDQQQDQQEQEQDQQEQSQQEQNQQQQQQQEQEMQELENMSEEEKKQVLEQWLRQIKDDPGGLLRRKMYMEYQKRQKQNKRLQSEGEKVW
jgi:Ca-activated chloride channel family protein